VAGQTQLTAPQAHSGRLLKINDALAIGRWASPAEIKVNLDAALLLAGHKSKDCRTRGVAPRSKEPWVPGLALPLNIALRESLLSLGTETDRLWAWDLIISFKPYNNTMMHM